MKRVAVAQSMTHFCVVYIEIFKRFLHVGCEHLFHSIAGNIVGNIEVQNGILHNLQSTATLPEDLNLPISNED
jgi:hypothetical protein